MLLSINGAEFHYFRECMFALDFNEMENESGVPFLLKARTKSILKNDGTKNFIFTSYFK